MRMLFNRLEVERKRGTHVRGVPGLLGCCWSFSWNVYRSVSWTLGK